MNGMAATASRRGDLPRGRGTWQVIRDDEDELYAVMTELLSDGSAYVYRQRTDKRTGQSFGDVRWLPAPDPVAHQSQCTLGHYGKTVSADICVHGHETTAESRL